MFETKNVEDLDSAAFNQTATYLGDRIGRLGMIVTRRRLAEAMQRKAMSIWNDSGPQRKVILVLTDENITELLTAAARNKSNHTLDA